MINFEDYFGDLTEEEYVRQTEEHFEWLKNNAFIPPACENCSNHPKNGGSGICHCTLGASEIKC